MNKKKCRNFTIKKTTSIQSPIHSSIHPPTYYSSSSSSTIPAALLSTLINSLLRIAIRICAPRFSSRNCVYTQNNHIISTNPQLNTRLFLTGCVVTVPRGPRYSQVYPVRKKKNESRTGACASQYPRETSSVLETAMKSLIEFRMKTRPKREVARGFRWKVDLGCGRPRDSPNIKTKFCSAIRRGFVINR